MDKDYVYPTFLNFCKERENDKEWEKILRKDQPQNKSKQEIDMEKLRDIISLECKDTSSMTKEEQDEHKARKDRAHIEYLTSSEAVAKERRDYDPDEIRPETSDEYSADVWSWKEDVSTRMDFCDKFGEALKRCAKAIEKHYYPTLGCKVHYDSWTIWSFQNHFGRARPGHLYIFAKSRKVYVYEPEGKKILAEALRSVAL